MRTNRFLDEYNERFVKNPNADKLEAAPRQAAGSPAENRVRRSTVWEAPDRYSGPQRCDGGTLQSGGGEMGAERRLRLLIVDQLPMEW